MDSFVITMLDKYGPLGVALAIVCLLLWLIVQRVLPSMNATWAQQIEAERDSSAKLIEAERQVFREALGLIRDEMATQRDIATERHEEIIDRLGGIEGKVDRLGPRS